MAVEMNSNISTNYVRVNVGDDTDKRYYIIQKDKADSFVSTYKKQALKTSIITNTAFLTSILGGTFLTMFASKSIKSTFLRYVINCMGGVAAGMASLPLTGKFAKNKENKIIAKFGAQEDR